MAWTQALLQLQDVDHTLKTRQQRLEKIEQLLDDNTELVAAAQRAESVAGAAQLARKHQQELEFELGQVQVKRDLTESNLYSGRITNSRELQDLQAELQSLKRRVAELEDRLLEAMMEREEADEVADNAAEELGIVRSRLEQAQASLIAERAQLRSECEALHAQQQQLRSSIPPEAIDSYDYLKERTGNIPVAQLKGDVCSVCGTEVLRPTQQKVHRGQVANCDTCLRLLVE